MKTVWPTSHRILFPGRRLTFLVCGALTVLLIGLLSGCSILPEPTPDPTRYFILTGQDKDTPEGATNEAARKIRIGLRNVDLPGYLRNTKSMLIRRGSNEIIYNDYARWGEPLELGINRIVRQRLLATDTVGGVVAPPFPAGLRRDFDIIVRVLACEGTVDGEGKAGTHFSVAYAIFKPDTEDEVVIRRTYTAPSNVWDGKNYGDLARLLSESLGGLAEDIAANLPK